MRRDLCDHSVHGVIPTMVSPPPPPPPYPRKSFSVSLESRALLLPVLYPTYVCGYNDASMGIDCCSRHQPWYMHAGGLTR